ncbi:MAG: hypothetical protein RR524_03210 [Erysipelotrichaceae bacterium]
MALFCLFIPSFIAIWIYESSVKEDNNLKVLIHYAIFVLLVNFLSMLILSVYADNQVFVLSFDNSSVLFLIKYLLLASSFAFFLGVCAVYVSKNMSIRFNWNHSTKKGKQDEK